MKKLILISGVLLFFTACKEISGEFKVQKSFTAVAENNCGWDPFGSCEPTKQVTIQPGNYRSKINFSSKKNIKIEIKANKVTETILLDRPDNFEFPTNGNFHLTAQEIKQNFSVHGSVQTNVFDSERRREHESCTYTVNEYVCYPRPSGKPECGYQPRQVWGYRSVEYYLKTTSRDLIAQLVNEKESLADFDGHREDVEKIYVYQGICR